jgi:isoleucyl-tRNA synthetase
MQERQLLLMCSTLAPCCSCRYGIWGDWSSPYITLQPSYEAAQLAVFGKMFLNGHIYR